MEACAECSRDCVILHGKNENTSPNVSSFFKIMIGSQFSELLYIPPKFAPTVSGLLNQNIRLEDSGGRQWEVTLSKVDGSFAFQRGWNAFSCDHGLEVGYLLLFHYLGSHFRVDIYDGTGCRKVDFPESDESDEEDQEGGGPSTRLRKRTAKPTKESKADKPRGKKQANDGKKNVKTGTTVKRPTGRNEARMEKFEEAEYKCDLEGCTMSFDSKQELTLHKKNVCPVKGCRKQFFSHKYLVQHRGVHLDDRPLKCPWKGCKMTFKWAWARTEHIRVHTGARPYICAEPGCGQTFRFVSDFGRHKRETGHSVKGKG